MEIQPSLATQPLLYYRLQLLDNDGKSTYSGIVHLTNPTATTATPLAITIIPNPIGSEMQVLCTLPNAAPVEVQLQDIAGATFIHRQWVANKGDNLFTLPNLSSLPPGVYLVRIVQGSAAGIAKAIKQ